LLILLSVGLYLFSTCVQIPADFLKLHIYGYGAYHMLYSFLGGWVPQDDGCCTLF
jgi:hypothetical protein